MIGEYALSQFRKVWDLFDRKIFELGGSLFLIDPFRPYFPFEYPQELTAENAKLILHEGLYKWGLVAQAEPERITMGEIKLQSGKIIEIKEPENPIVRESRHFILHSFFNLCSLALYKRTLEELIFEAYYKDRDDPTASQEAFIKLVAISNSFLLAEWKHNIIFEAISRQDEAFFKKLSKAIGKDVPFERFDSARTWLGATLLWYLGGKDMKRLDFMLFLRKENILSPRMEELSFNAMLSKLKLKKDFHITITG